MAVFTSDGESIGRVKDVRSGCMRIDAVLRPDYWLSLSLIHTVSTVVGLAIPKADIAANKLDEPVIETVAS
jgi:hypothetical protein